MKTAVVVGRWQIDNLHQGHKEVLEYAHERADKLVVLIGVPLAEYTNRNPLTYKMRKKLVEGFHFCDVHPIYDKPGNDAEWSRQLDEILEANGYEDITLYGGRDSFIPHYSGKYPCITIPSQLTFSSTERRENIKKYQENFDESFRQGVIYTIEHMFPKVYPTVDVALLKYYEGETKLLLGKKPGEIKWCFPGGFVDPADVSLEAAAMRELTEEAGELITHEIKYIKSVRVDDARYKETRDAIMTSLFVTYLMGGEPKAGDDLEDVKWFDLERIDVSTIMVAHHIPLFETLTEYLGKKKFEVERFD